MHLNVLGAVATEDETFRQHQPIVLLAYLAHGGPRSRQHLASVFWPAAKKPLNNLSSALSRIRQQRPGVIVVDEGRVGTTCSTDALAVLAAAEAGRLDEAIAGYAGRFLDGYQLKSVGMELEEWIFETREAIAGAVSLRAVERSRLYADEGDYERSADLAETALAVSFDGYPLTEHLSFLHGVLSRSSRASALRVRTEAAAMGIQLDLEPNTGDSAGAPTMDAAPVAAEPGTAVIGRTEEIDALDELTANHRLVTVYGFGGIGKTTLVSEYLKLRTTGDASPAIRVDLGSIEDVEEVEAHIGAALGVDSDPGSLVVHLSDAAVESTLLFLDDVSPTTAICALIESLVAEATLLSVITTSRARFPDRPSGELQLLGLSIGGGEAHSDAARLFQQRAASIVGRGDFGSSDWERVEEICSAIGGMPLAIELTAAWLRLVPLDEVMTLVRQGVLLGERLPGATTTLEGVIRQSSALLTPELQRALADLSVLRGSFDWLAARSIADIGVSDLTELHDHSMIALHDHGRMECHPLVAAYAASQLAERPDRERELRQNHSRYYLRFLADAVEQLTGPELGVSLNTLTIEHDNMAAAWNHAIEEQRWEQLERLVEPFDTYLLRSGQLVVARRLYEAAHHRLAETEGGWDDLRANVANNLAWVYMLLGDATKATRLCHDTIDKYEHLHVATQVALHRTKAALLSNTGAFEDALVEYLGAIELVDEQQDGRLWALLREDIGRGHMLLGHIDMAQDSFRATLDAAREFMDPHMEARSYLNLGQLEIEREPAGALVLFDEGERITIEHGLLHLRSYFCEAQGRAHLMRTNLADAESAYRRGIDLAEETGDPSIRATNELGLARTLAAQGQAEEARKYFEICLRLALRSGDWSLGLGASIEVCAGILRGPADEKTTAFAHELLFFAVDHPGALAHDRKRGRAALAGFEPDTRLPADLRLDETCERAFRLLRYAAPLAADS